MFLKSQDDFYHDKQYVKTGQSKNSCRNWMLHFLFSSIRVFLIWGHLKKKNSIDFLRSKLIFCHNDLSWITMGKSSFLSLLILCLEIELNKSSICTYSQCSNIQNFWFTNKIFVMMCPLGFSLFQHLPFRHWNFGTIDKYTFV